MILKSLQLSLISLLIPKTGFVRALYSVNIVMFTNKYEKNLTVFLSLLRHVFPSVPYIHYAIARFLKRQRQ